MKVGGGGGGGEEGVKFMQAASALLLSQLEAKLLCSARDDAQRDVHHTDRLRLERSRRMSKRGAIRLGVVKGLARQRREEGNGKVTETFASMTPFNTFKG